MQSSDTVPRGGGTCSCSPSVSTAQHVVGTQQTLLTFCLATGREGAEGRSLMSCSVWGLGSGWAPAEQRVQVRREAVGSALWGQWTGTQMGRPAGCWTCQFALGDTGPGCSSGVLGTEGQLRRRVRGRAVRGEGCRDPQGPASWGVEGTLPSCPFLDRPPRHRGHQAGQHGRPHGGDHGVRVSPAPLQPLRLQQQQGLPAPLRHACGRPVRQALQV